MTQCYDDTVPYLILSSSMESTMLFLMLTVSSSSCSRTASRVLSVSVFWWSEDRHTTVGSNHRVRWLRQISHLLHWDTTTLHPFYPTLGSVHGDPAHCLSHTVSFILIINHIILNIILLTSSLSVVMWRTQFSADMPQGFMRHILTLHNWWIC